MSELHDYLKSQESLITSSIEGKTLIDFIDRNADEYPDYPALNTPANSEYSACCLLYTSPSPRDQ